MLKVKIIGAGSIGNHMANAASTLGWGVCICDIDPKALDRTKSGIYPSRYGAWNDSIKLYESKEAPVGGFDLIIIGTPPDSHFPIALDILKQETPKAFLIEKPLCKPDLENADTLYEMAKNKGVKIFTGYDHVLGFAASKVAELINANKFGKPETIDVEFREHWGGIFNAHPWLNGPADSYLGYWKKGGGALGEHSHALNLWQYFSDLTSCGKVIEVNANLEYVNDGIVDYDKLSLLNLRTENGIQGRVVQDVVTKPTRKWARIQWEKSFIEWHAGFKPGVDAVIFENNGEIQTFEFPKTRPQDFILELEHIQKVMATSTTSPISFEKGLETMLVISGAHKSNQLKRSININYSKGWNATALNS